MRKGQSTNDILLLRPIPEEKRYLVATTVVYEVGEWLVEVPEGFKTDGASVPRFFWRIVGTPFEPDFIGPAVAHDYAYKNKIGTRRAADRAFRLLLDRTGVSRWRQWAMWLAVRVIGWMFYGRG